MVNFTSSYFAYKNKLDEQDRFNKPMPWIGIYIASTSLFCILAMVADLIHGLRNRKLWFPCKYFTLNAASLMVIAVAMKLPLDLSNPMPGDADQVSKLGSMTFMCIMMANILPSLATMDGKELVTNMIALSVFIITLVVNVSIQIRTKVIDVGYLDVYHTTFPLYKYLMRPVAAIYVGMLIFLLIIYTCSSLAILKSKHMLQSKYQQVHERVLKNQHLGTSSVEKLNEHVSYYWIMAETGNPQFMIASSATTTASGVICALNILLYHIFVLTTIDTHHKPYYDSSYKWSVVVISKMQYLGIILGTVAPFSRCFSSLSFKLSTKLISKHTKVFTVESYWIQKLCEWKQSTLPSPFCSRRCNIVLENLKIILLDICIGFQKSVVVACKMIALVPVFILICVWCCSHCWKWSKSMFSASNDNVLEKTIGQVEQKEDRCLYALQILDDIVLSDRTLKGILKSLRHLIQRAEKKQPNNLMKLLAVSKHFKGVAKYDNLCVSHLVFEKYLDCWSLPLVNLTAIAISLPEIENNNVDWLLRSVSEGLAYVRLVEETLNATDEYTTSRKAAKLLWQGVEFNHKWLGIKVRKLEPQLKTSRLIVQWFSDMAIKMVDDVKHKDIRYQSDNSICRSVSANSMYRITETILLSYHNDIDDASQHELYEELVSMIADILAACFINLPQTIMMKCEASEIEKLQESVDVAARCLGETMQIIKILEDREIPSMSRDEFPFIGKWCSYYNHSSP